MKKTNVMRTLERKGILYTAYETKTLSDQEIDAVSVSIALGVDKSMVYKTLVVKEDLHGYIVAVIPADAQLNLKALAKVTQNKKLKCFSLNSFKKLQVTFGEVVHQLV